MLFLRFSLLVIGFGLLTAAVGAVLYDIYLAWELRRLLGTREETPTSPEAAPPPLPAPRRPGTAIGWSMGARLAAVAIFSILVGTSIVVVPDGRAAVRISQVSGALPETLYAGTHWILPLVQRVETFDTRDHVFATSATEGPHERLEALTVEAREGLSVGLAVTVRYRLDPRRLAYFQANLPPR
jgi:hypothetical protein